MKDLFKQVSNSMTFVEFLNWLNEIPEKTTKAKSAIKTAVTSIKNKQKTKEDFVRQKNE
jgi:hypothetical protein